MYLVGMLRGTIVSLAGLATVLVLALQPAPVGSQAPVDSDGDGVPDALDNCTLVPNGPLAATAGCGNQEDGDEDGFGNPCDLDSNNDGVAGVQDYVNAFNNLSGSNAQLNSEDPHCEGWFGSLATLVMISEAFYTTPGPSGLACSAANEKFTCPPVDSAGWP